jgi:hypothetical protein
LIMMCDLPDCSGLQMIVNCSHGGVLEDMSECSW